MLLTEKTKGFIKSKDFVISLFMITFGIAVFLHSMNYEFTVKLIPTIVGSLSFIIGTLILVIGISGKKSENYSEILLTRKETMMFLAMFVTASLMNMLGFYSALFLGITAINFIIFTKSQKRIVVSLAVSAAVILVLFIVFQYILFIPTPRGMFY